MDFNIVAIATHVNLRDRTIAELTFKAIQALKAFRQAPRSAMPFGRSLSARCTTERPQPGSKLFSINDGFFDKEGLTLRTEKWQVD